MFQNLNKYDWLIYMYVVYGYTKLKSDYKKKWIFKC